MSGSIPGLGSIGGAVPQNITTISTATGSVIGDMNNGASSLAFDGVSNTTSHSANASWGSGASRYVGKTWTSPKIFYSATIYGGSDFGFSNPHVSVTLNVRGKNGSAPSGPTDGTTIGTATFTDQADETGGRSITSSNAGAPWDHWIVEISAAGASFVHITEVAWSELI